VLARWLAVDRTMGVLITAGTSICGGSAIAALGPAIGASAEAMSVSLATVFVLNAVALYVFPAVAHLVHLSQHQFGVWARWQFTTPVLWWAPRPRTGRTPYATPRFSSWHARCGSCAHRDPSADNAPPRQRRRQFPVGVRWRHRRAVVIGRRRNTGANHKRGAAIPWFIALFVLAAFADRWRRPIRCTGLTRQALSRAAPWYSPSFSLAPT